MSSTNSLERFVNSLCSKFDSDIGKNAGDREEMLKLMQKLNGPKALNLIRQETKMLVLMVRVANQESKEKYREDHPELFEDEEEIEKENMQGGLFDE